MGRQPVLTAHQNASLNASLSWFRKAVMADYSASLFFFASASKQNSNAR